MVRFARGEFAAGVAHAEDAAALYRAQGDRSGLANALYATGLSLLAFARDAPSPEQQDGFARADAAFREQLAIARDRGDQRGAALAMGGLGYLALCHGDGARADAHLTPALRTVEALGDQRVLGWTLLNLGLAASLQGDDVRAAPWFSRALAIYRDLGDRWATGHVLKTVALLAARRGWTEDAVRLLAAADAVHQAGGMPVNLAPPVDQEPTETAIRSSLSDDAFAAARDAGRALPLDEAVGATLALLEAVAAGAAHGAAPSPVDAPALTTREREVLRLLAAGLSDREIAGALSISPRTVGGHVTNVLAKLGADSRTAAAAFAIRHGLA